MELASPKRVWINDPMYSASAAFPWMEDKNESIYLSIFGKIIHRTLIEEKTGLTSFEPEQYGNKNAFIII